MIRVIVISIIYAINVVAAQSAFIALLTLPLFIIIALNLARIKTPELKKDDMFWFLMFIFFVIGPCQSIHGGMIGARPDSPIGGVTRYIYENSEFILAMAIVVLFSIAFSTVANIAERRDRNRSQGTYANVEPDPHVLFGVVILSFLLFVVLSGGVSNLLAARLEKVGEDIAQGRTIPLAMQMICTCVIAASWRARPLNNIVALAPLAGALCLLAIAQNPFNTSRFALLGTWIPVVLTLLRGNVRATSFYAVALLSIVFLFPILSVTTRVGIDGLDQIDATLLFDGFFKLPFVDIFDTLVHAVRMVEQSGWLYGQKTLAIVLFFVPRIVWPDKPIVGGLDVGNDLFNARMVGTPNLSFFIGGDFYMDFGLIAVVIGGAVCGYLFGRISGRGFSMFFGQNIYNYVLIAALPILIRGPVGAILMLFTCQIAVILLLHNSVRLFNSLKRAEV